MNYLLLLLFLLPSPPTGEQEALYSIDSFAPPIRSLPASGNTVIEPHVADTLVQIEEMPELIPSDIVLRRRFGPQEYALYLGKRHKDAHTSLSAFMPPRGYTVKDFVYKKLYVRETDNPNMDMTNVYFDNEMIYVENAAKIFYRDNGWHMIPLLERMHTTLYVTSVPESALVTVDGVEYGTTPVTLRNLRSSFVVVAVRKEGYYQAESFVNLEESDAVTKKFVLPAMISSTEGTYLNPYSYTFEYTASVEELDIQIERLKRKIAWQKSKNEEEIVKYEEEYPPFKPQGEFEKTDDFLRRKELYDEEKKSGRLALKVKGDPKVHKLETELLKLTRYRAEIEHRLYHRYLSTSVVHLNRYEPDMEYFPVDIRVNEAGHNFVFTGVVEIPLAVARGFKENLHLGRLKLTYRNRIFKQGELGTETRILYEYTRLSILFRGSEYTLEGKCSFPEQIEVTDTLVRRPEEKGKDKQMRER